jgi:hypothetical protein
MSTSSTVQAQTHEALETWTEQEQMPSWEETPGLDPHKLILNSVFYALESFDAILQKKLQAFVARIPLHCGMPPKKARLPWGYFALKLKPPEHQLPVANLPLIISTQPRQQLHLLELNQPKAPELEKRSKQHFTTSLNESLVEIKFLTPPLEPMKIRFCLQCNNPNPENLLESVTFLQQDENAKPLEKQLIQIEELDVQLIRVTIRLNTHFLQNLAPFSPESILSLQIKLTQTPAALFDHVYALRIAYIQSSFSLGNLDGQAWESIDLPESCIDMSDITVTHSSSNPSEYPHFTLRQQEAFCLDFPDYPEPENHVYFIEPLEQKISIPYAHLYATRIPKPIQFHAKTATFLPHGVQDCDALFSNSQELKVDHPLVQTIMPLKLMDPGAPAETLEQYHRRFFTLLNQKPSLTILSKKGLHALLVTHFPEGLRIHTETLNPGFQVFVGPKERVFAAGLTLKHLESKLRSLFDPNHEDIKHVKLSFMQNYPFDVCMDALLKKDSQKLEVVIQECFLDCLEKDASPSGFEKRLREKLPEVPIRIWSITDPQTGLPLNLSEWDKRLWPKITLVHKKEE